jgi:hypothetical protein
VLVTAQLVVLALGFAAGDGIAVVVVLAVAARGCKCVFSLCLITNGAGSNEDNWK